MFYFIRWFINYRRTRIFLSKSSLSYQNVVQYIEQSFALNAAAESALFSSPWWLCEPVIKGVFWHNIYKVNTIDVTKM